MSDDVSQPLQVNPRGRTAILLDPFYKEHDTGPEHPEAVDRYEAVVTGLRERAARPGRLSPRAMRSDNELLAVHAAKYLDIVREDVWFGAGELSTGDVVLSPRSLTVALACRGRGAECGGCGGGRGSWRMRFAWCGRRGIMRRR